MAVSSVTDLKPMTSMRRILAMAILCLITTMSYADRTLLTVLQEPMKHELGLSDSQLGLIAGPAFAILYGLVGIPIGRLAERFSRKNIIIISLTVWSAMTAVCGAATNLFTISLGRVGVGAAESGAQPATHALVADYFPPHQRGRAMAAYNLAIPLGLTIGAVAGALIAEHYGWRMAFIATGAPGLVLAVVAWFLVVEPKRTHDGAHAAPVLSHRAAFKLLLTDRTFLFMLLAACAGGIATHGVNSFSASFFLRRHGLTLTDVGVLFGTAHGVLGISGALMAGFVADFFARKDSRAYLAVSAFGATGAVVTMAIAFNAGSWSIAAPVFLGSYLFTSCIPTSSFAAVQNHVDSRVRATAAALYLFCLTVVGSLGPWGVGVLSDIGAGKAFPAALGPYAAACPGGRAIASRAAEIGDACAKASSAGLQGALMFPVAVFALIVASNILAMTASGNRAIKSA